MKVNSFYDSRGALWVACTECQKGYHGTDKDKCSGGWDIKRFNGQGCFLGDLLPKVKAEFDKKEKKNEGQRTNKTAKTDAS